MTLGHVTIFESLGSVHVFKDVGQFAAAFAKMDPTAPPSTLLHNTMEDVAVPAVLQPWLRTCRMAYPSRWRFYWEVLKTVRREEARTVTLYHATRDHLLLAVLLRLAGQRVYLKLDMDGPTADRLDATWRVQWRPANWLIQTLFGMPHLVSCEDADVFKKLKGYPWASRHLALVPNAMLHEVAPRPSTAETPDRQNVIIVVGRLGAEQKNCDMILDALEALPPKTLTSWRIHLCGPVTLDFKHRFNQLINRRNDITNILILRGELDRETLFQAYQESKVFLMTSRYEGFSLAALEAAWAGCYLAATPVGGMSQLTDEWRLGYRLATEDVSGLASFLQALAHSEIRGLEEVILRQRYIHSNFALEAHALNILKKLAPKEYSI